MCGISFEFLKPASSSKHIPRYIALCTKHRDAQPPYNVYTYVFRCAYYCIIWYYIGYRICHYDIILSAINLTLRDNRELISGWAMFSYKCMVGIYYIQVGTCRPIPFDEIIETSSVICTQAQLVGRCGQVLIPPVGILYKWKIIFYLLSRPTKCVFQADGYGNNT